MTDEEREGYLEFLTSRRARILARIEEAARVSGRGADEVEAIAVSKTVGVDEVVLAWRAGWRAFGENRPQELVRKLAGIESHPEMDGVRFDMIGNLQTNKINQVLGRVSLIHSVSSAHLATAISKRAEVRGHSERVLLEVNVSGEESKSGFTPEEVHSEMDDLLGMGGIEICGLMTMAPANDPDAARRTFSGLRELREQLSSESGLGLATLSCGMSDDFAIAVEEGSTLVRLGRTVFDPNHDLVTE